VNTFPTKTPNLGLFRGTVLVFAFVLGCQATWILMAEFFRPPHSDFSATRQPAAVAATDQNGAALAASFGLIRGDLWSEDALTYLDLFSTDNRHSSNAQIGQAREVADRALAFAPHNAGVWLVLASVNSRFDWLNSNAAAALRMSYYTGANETELIPLRLLLAVQSVALGDSDFQQLVRHDIRTIVTRKPELKPAIVAAYRDTAPIGRQFIEDTLEEIDPTLLTWLHSKG
jgi:hypothetical protein